MSESETPEKKRPHRSTSQGFRDSRQAALNAALRANLKRRKAADKPDTPAAPDDHANAQDTDRDQP